MSTVAFELVPATAAHDPALREQLLETWVRVTDAGGAVGFVPPADPAVIGPTLDAALSRVASGQDALGILRVREAGASDPAGPAAGRAVGMGILAASASPLRRHWRTVLRLMVDPGLQGTGAGRTLLTGLHDAARGLDLQFLCLSVRGGLGIEDFYGHLGYAVYGRNPGAIRVAAGDDRDEILMRIAL